MNEYPEFIFTSNSAAFYEWVEEIDPEMFARSARVAEGRWEIVGGWWIEPDCNIPGGESFVRQALIRAALLPREVRADRDVGYNVDTFGHHGMLPQILRRAAWTATSSCAPARTRSACRRRSSGGSRRTARACSRSGCRTSTARRSEDLGYHIDKSLAELPDGWTEMMAFYGVGNHGGGPTRENLDSIRRLDGAGAMPRLAPQHAAPLLRPHPRADRDIPVVRDDLQHHAIGCYSAHSGIKRWNRQAENAARARRDVGDGRRASWARGPTRTPSCSAPGSRCSSTSSTTRWRHGHRARLRRCPRPARRGGLDRRPGPQPRDPVAEPAHRHPERPAGHPDRRVQPARLARPHDGRARVRRAQADRRPARRRRPPRPFQQVQSYATVSSWRSRLAFEAEVAGARLPDLRDRTAGARPSLGHAAAGGGGAHRERPHSPGARPGERPDRPLVLREERRGRRRPGRRLPAARRSSSTTPRTRGATAGWRTATSSARSSRRTSSSSESGPVRAILRVESRYGTRS